MRSQAHAAVILHHLPAVLHPDEWDGRLDQLRLRPPVQVGGCEQRQHLVGKPLHLPKCQTASKLVLRRFR